MAIGEGEHAKARDKLVRTLEGAYRFMRACEGVYGYMYD